MQANYAEKAADVEKRSQEARAAIFADCESDVRPQTAVSLQQLHCGVGTLTNDRF